MLSVCCPAGLSVVLGSEVVEVSTPRPLRVVVAAKLEADALEVKSALNPSQVASGRLAVVHSSLLRWITALMTERARAEVGCSCKPRVVDHAVD